MKGSPFLSEVSLIKCYLEKKFNLHISKYTFVHPYYLKFDTYSKRCWVKYFSKQCTSDYLPSGASIMDFTCADSSKTQEHNGNHIYFIVNIVHCLYSQSCYCEKESCTNHRNLTKLIQNAITSHPCENPQHTNAWNMYEHLTTTYARGFTYPTCMPEQRGELTESLQKLRKMLLEDTFLRKIYNFLY